MILQGDCLEELKTLPSDSIDTVITDPPYGYSFMGKDWDKAVPSVEIWQECLRVLKPGAFMCVMSAPRSDVQNAMISRLMEAGFRLDFTPIYWTYASGFPKAGNIGKLVDKRLGAKRETIKVKPRPETSGTMSGSSETRPWIEKSRELGYHEVAGNKAVTAQAEALDGSYAGFQPKPAVEVIIVAMKPLSEKTYVDQALANGHGISWLDDGRIPTDAPWSETSAPDIRGNAYASDNSEKTRLNVSKPHDGGRFPANLLVSDDVLNDGTYTKDTGHFPKAIKSNSAFESGNREQTEQKLQGGGSYSRYFDLDKWAQTLPFLITPKASKTEKNKGLEHIEPKHASKMSGGTFSNQAGTSTTNTERKYSNHHPTVKPLKLMSYLITLFSRPGDTVLDPFVGSGTTVVAAKQLDRNGIGIEREAEYAEIARARVAAEDVKVEDPQLSLV